MTARKCALLTSSAFAVLLAMVGQAHATVSIECTDIKQDTGVNLLLGAGPVPSFLSVTIALGDRLITTVPGQPGEQATIAQAYDDGEFVRVDLVDTQAENKVATIRIVRADESTGPFQIGYVQIDEGVAVGITCVGP